MQEFNGVVGIVFQRSSPNKYVLIKNKKSKNVTFPAGAREDNETPMETLEREINEETGLSKEDYKIIETPIVHEFIYNSNKKDRAGQKSRQLIYIIETLKKDLQPNDLDVEILGWFSEKEVNEKLTFSDSKELFAKAIKCI
ncbi:MAG: NUDIX domain-containing protein [Candidatus Nanoarchaeia archaeon]